MATIRGDNGSNTLNGTNDADTIYGFAGDDDITGRRGNDVIFGGAGDDFAFANVTTDGADTVDLGQGYDAAFITANSAGQVRVTFTSAEVGNDNPNDSNTLANQDGGLAVRLQAETAGGALTGPISRYDDEGISFVSDTAGLTFDVRDLVSGEQRGANFGVVALGTRGDDDFLPFVGREGSNYYINGGAGDDYLEGGTGNDFLVGGTGGDLLVGSRGNDTLLGGAGNDFLNGGLGNDTLNGGAGIDQATFNFNLSAARISVNANGQTVLTGQGTDTLVGVEQFQFNDRFVDNADGAPLVDDLFYLIRNPDVAAAGVDPDTHYAQFGYREGRDPNAFFSTSGYLSTYTDVAAAGINPLTHYDQFGWREGRDPSANFDTTSYLAAYPDVAAAGINPLTHYLQFGIAEGRQAFGDGVIDPRG